MYSMVVFSVCSSNANALYVQNHHLLRFRLSYRNCQLRKQSDPFHFVVSAIRSFVRISVVLLLHILFLYYI